MRRASFVVCLVLAAGFATITAGCGGSGDLAGPDSPAGSAGGRSVLQGAVVAPGIASAASAASVTASSTGGGWVVSVNGTSISSELDQDGRFVLTGLPAGTVTLRIDGPGVSYQVQVSGLAEGQVASVEIRVTGGSAVVSGEVKCTPSAETYFSGALERREGAQLVVAGRTVDASQIHKVWRGEARIQLADLALGEKVKVWGTLRGDGVVVAEEIAALTSGPGSSKTWTTFSGRVESVDGKSVYPTPTGSKYPTLYVAGRKVKTDAGTSFKWSDGSACDGSVIKVGDSVAVEGWSLPQGYVEATRLVVNKR